MSSRFWERIPPTGGSLCLNVTQREVRQECNETMVGS